MTYKATLPNKTKNHINYYLVVLLYLLGILVGAAVIIIIPMIYQKSGLLELAEKRAHCTLYEFDQYDSSTFGTEYYLFDAKGRFVVQNRLFVTEEEKSGFVSYVPEILEKGRLYRPVLLNLNDATGTLVPGLIIGIKCTGPNGRDFAALIVRDLPDMRIEIITYLCIFTIMFIIGLVFVRYIIRQQQLLDKTRRDLFANVGHEFKTPITSIRAMAEILYDGLDKTPEDRMRYANSIIKESDNLRNLVNDILQLTRMQNSKIKYNKEHCYADGIFRPPVDRYAMLCADLNIHFMDELDGIDQIPAVFTDTEKMITVLNTLLSNAIKFTEAGQSIRVSYKVKKDYLTICVADTGCGIAAKDLPFIFDRFYQSDETRNTSGTGLGLSIANEIIKGLGEKLWVKSSPGKGSEFYFTVHFDKNKEDPCDHSRPE